MILKLLRTDLQSNWLVILLAAAASVELWITTIGKTMPGYTTPGSLTLGLWPFALLMVGLGARRSVQKQRRLLAQLPVTATAIRMASWLGYFTLAGVACLIGVAILLISPPAPDWGWMGVAESASRKFAVFTCMVGQWRLFGIGNSISSSLRSPLNQIFTVAAGILGWVLLIPWAWSSGAWATGHDAVIAPWTFVQITGGFALTMILLDILLDRFADKCVA